MAVRSSNTRAGTPRSDVPRHDVPRSDVPRSEPFIRRIYLKKLSILSVAAILIVLGVFYLSGPTTSNVGKSTMSSQDGTEGSPCGYERLGCDGCAPGYYCDQPSYIACDGVCKKAPICENGICEKDNGENEMNCPQDCSSTE